MNAKSQIHFAVGSKKLRKAADTESFKGITIKNTIHKGDNNE
jgi:hypothetical protein